MTLQAFTRIKNRLGSAPLCRVCGRKIKLGDRVVSSILGGTRRNYYIYHENCYNNTRVEA